MRWAMASKWHPRRRLVLLLTRYQRSVRPVPQSFVIFLQIGVVLSGIASFSIMAKVILPRIFAHPRAACRILPYTTHIEPATRIHTRIRPAWIRIQHYEMFVRMHTLMGSMTSAHYITINLRWTVILQFISQHVRRHHQLERCPKRSFRGYWHDFSSMVDWYMRLLLPSKGRDFESWQSPVYVMDPLGLQHGSIEFYGRWVR